MQDFVTMHRVFPTTIVILVFVVATFWLFFGQGYSLNYKTFPVRRVCKDTAFYIQGTSFVFMYSFGSESLIRLSIYLLTNLCSWLRPQTKFFFTNIITPFYPLIEMSFLSWFLHHTENIPCWDCVLLCLSGNALYKTHTYLFILVTFVNLKQVCLPT